MISSRKLLHMMRISPMNLLPLSAANWISMPITNRCTRDGIIVRRLECGIRSIRNFGTEGSDVADTKPSMTVPRRRILLHKWYEQMDSEERNRAVTIDCMMGNMYELASEYLLNPELMHISKLSIDMWDEEDTCYKYWLAIFERLETPLAIELKEKLQDAGLSSQEFCRAIVDVYAALQCERRLYLCSVRTESEDVINVLNYLNVSTTQYECVRILFSLHNIYGWKI